MTSRIVPCCSLSLPDSAEISKFQPSTEPAKRRFVFTHELSHESIDENAQGSVWPNLHRLSSSKATGLILMEVLS